MTEENLSKPEGEEPQNPDTNTDDEIDKLEVPEPVGQPAIPVAEEAAAPPPPAPAPRPRVFPQHYTLLYGAVVTGIASLAVWERAHVFGVDISGPQMLSGMFLLAMATYCTIVGILNVLQGRLRGMLASFVTGVAALYFGIKAYFRTIEQDSFLSREDISRFLSDNVIPQQFRENMDAFPKAALDAIETWQDKYIYWIGQFGPGVWLSLLGGLLIVLVFLKALVGGGKKKEEAPAQPARRRGRR
ncbi:MAG: hypothetical protein ACYSUN_04995 [Planctomycetota bacterium]|jgi:hypothetical protein